MELIATRKYPPLTSLPPASHISTTTSHISTISLSHLYHQPLTSLPPASHISTISCFTISYVTHVCRGRDRGTWSTQQNVTTHFMKSHSASSGGRTRFGHSLSFTQDYITHINTPVPTPRPPPSPGAVTCSTEGRGPERLSQAVRCKPDHLPPSRKESERWSGLMD